MSYHLHVQQCILKQFCCRRLYFCFVVDDVDDVVVVVVTGVAVVVVYLECHISPSIHLSVHLVQLVFT